jgi:HSP20 family molecular chaperone IbpA
LQATCFSCLEEATSGAFLRSVHTPQLSADPVLTLQREVNRLFDDMFSPAGFPASSQRGVMVKPIPDVREDDNELCVSVDLPGVDSSDLDGHIDGDLLSISGDKKSESVGRKETCLSLNAAMAAFSNDSAAVRADPKQSTPGSTPAFWK